MAIPLSRLIVAIIYNKIKDGDRGVGRITRRAIYYVICGLFVATVGKRVIEDQIRLLESTCAVLIF